MSHADPGPLAGYNSLQDKHLAGYFNNTRMRQHLRRSGLVSKSGDLVTETTYRLNMARKEHQKHVRDLLAQAIVHKALDIERHRQCDIKKKLEEIAKIELVRRVRMEKAHQGDEDIVPYLSPRERSRRPKSAVEPTARNPPGSRRPYTAPSKRPKSKKKSSVYVDKDGFPVHRVKNDPDSDSQDLDSTCLKGLDSHALNKASLHMTEEPDTGGKSPYKLDYALSPQPPKSGRGGRSASGRRQVYSKDGKRVRTKSTRGGGSTLHRREPAYSHAVAPQTMCDVTVRYRGQSFKVSYEKEDNRDEIMIYQQHCGGENLTVFHGWVEPGTDCVFTSRRHRGYPFGMTFYVNRTQVLTISACCEYKYKPGVILGGRKGHFRYVSVEGASPCYKCLVEAELAKRERDRYRGTQTEPPPPEPEPEVVTDAKSTQADIKDQEATEEGAAVDAGTAYDNDDFENDEEDEQDQEEDKVDKKKEEVQTDKSVKEEEQDEDKTQNDYDDDIFEDDDVKQSETEKDVSDNESGKETIKGNVAEDRSEDKSEVVVKRETSDDGSKKNRSEDERDSETDSKAHASDNESKQDMSDNERKRLASDNESIKEASNNESKKEASDNESIKEVSDNESKKATSDNESIKEVSDNESKKEVSDNESKKAASDNESIKEASDNESKKATSDNESIKQKSDNESKNETSDNESKKDKSDNGSITVTSDNESLEKTSDNESIKEKDERMNKFAEEKDYKGSSGEEKQKDNLEDEISNKMSEEDERKDEDRISNSSYVIEKENSIPKGISSVNEDPKEEDQTLRQSDESSQDTKIEEQQENIADVTKDNNDEPIREENNEYAEESEPESLISVSATSESVHSEKGEGRRTSFGHYLPEDSVATDTEEEMNKKDDVDGKTNNQIDSDDTRDVPVEKRDDEEMSESDQKGIKSDRDSVKDQHVGVEEKQESDAENERGSSPRDQVIQQVSNEMERESVAAITNREPEVGSNQDANGQEYSNGEKEGEQQHHVERTSSQSSVNSTLNNADEKDQENDGKNDKSEEFAEQRKETKNNVDDDDIGDNDHKMESSHEVEGNNNKADKENDSIHEEDVKEAHQKSTALGSSNSLRSNTGNPSMNDQTDIPTTDPSVNQDAAADLKKDDQLEVTPEGSREPPQVIQSEARDDKPAVQDATTSDQVKSSKRPDSATSVSSSGSSGSSNSSSSSSSSSGTDSETDKSSDEKTLDFSKRDLSPRGARKVAKALTKSENKNIESLILNGNPIGDRGIKTIIRALTDQQKDQLEDGKKSKLSEVNLGDCKIGTSGVEVIAKFLKNNSGVVNLNLSSNPDITLDGWKQLAEVLQNDPNLKSLNVSDCQMGGDSSAALLQGLVDNESLMELDIEGNNLAADGGKCLLDLVKDNGVITSIQFERGNNVAPQTALEIKEILETGSFVP